MTCTPRLWNIINLTMNGSGRKLLHERAVRLGFPFDVTTDAWFLVGVYGLAG